MAPRCSTPAAARLATTSDDSGPTRGPSTMTSGSWVPRWRRMRRSSTWRKRRKDRASAGWASMARPAAPSGSSHPVRSNRFPAMTRMPGPSQVSRAWASSPVRASVEGVAAGVSRRSLTTMMRRPSGMSTRVPPGSGAKSGAGAPTTGSAPVPAAPWVSVVAVTGPPVYGQRGSRLGRSGVAARTPRTWDDVRSGPPGGGAVHTCVDDQPRGSRARRDQPRGDHRGLLHRGAGVPPARRVRGAGGGGRSGRLRRGRPVGAGLLGPAGRGPRLVPPVGHRPVLGPAVRPLVRRRHPQRVLQLPRPPRGRRPR